MKRREHKTATALTDVEESAALRPGSTEIVPGESGAAFDLDERVSRERMAAHIRLVWMNRRFLAKSVGFGVLFSVAVAVVIPNRYQSTAHLMPPDTQSGTGLSMAVAALSGGASGLGGLANEMLGLKSTSDLLVGVLSSRTVADVIIHKFELSKVYGDSRMEDLRKDLAKHADISVDRKSQIITITVTDKDPHRAQAIAQAYVEELNRLVAEVSTSSARRERIFLEGRLNAVRQSLEAAEKGFGQFASKNTTIDVKEQGKAMVEAAATLQGQLIAARAELEGLRQIYTMSNVRVRSLQARIAELENQSAKVAGQGEDNPTQNADPKDSLYPSIRKLPLLGVTYSDLYRETKVQEVVYETLTQEYEMAKVQEAKEIPSVKVLDPPNLPDKKSFPPRALIILTGAALAFSCGLAWVTGSNMWRETDSVDPMKVVAQEIYESVRGAIKWGSGNNGSKGTPEAEPPGRNSES